ncbi:MAG: STAS domain-containing protein [Acidimicrobiales bacterium]
MFPSPLRIDDTTDRGWTVLHVAGDLDASTVPALRGRLSDMAAGGPSQVVVDLSRVTFLDSSGLGALIGGLRRLRSAGGEMRLVPGATPKVRRLLDQTGVGQLLPIFPTAEAATA